MRSNKKGFTIVELVIVIAVIAILAAVLIPTIAGLVKKAQQSADIQAVRQMNVALASEATPADYLAAGAILNKAGFNTEKGISPVYKDYSFYWYAPTNQVVYVNDANGAFELVFPEKIKDFPTAKNDDFYTIAVAVQGNVSAPKVSATDADVDKAMNTAIPAEVETFDDLMSYVTSGSDKALKFKDPNGVSKPGIAINGGEIKLTEDIVLDVTNRISGVGNTLIINIYGDVTIDLAGHSITQKGDGASLNLFSVRNGATLNIIDSVGGGAIYASLGTFQIDAGATVNLFGGTLAVTPTELRSGADIAYGFSTINMNGGVFNMYGGTIDTASDSEDYYEFAFSGYSVATSVVNIYSGTINTNNLIEGDRAGTVNDFR